MNSMYLPPADGRESKFAVLSRETATLIETHRKTSPGNMKRIQKCNMYNDANWSPLKICIAACISCVRTFLRVWYAPRKSSVDS